MEIKRLPFYDEKLDEILIEVQTCRNGFTKLELSLATITDEVAILQNNPTSDKHFKDELKTLKTLIPSMQQEITDFKVSFDSKLNGVAQF